MNTLSPSQKDKLTQLALQLVNQNEARVIVPAMDCQSGFWFGGGNMTVGHDNRLYLVGRYRNAGDSRTGLGKGERGLELAIFASANQGKSFEKVLQFSKAELNVGSNEVLSIEGAALHWSEDQVEIYVSTEKTGIGYPPPYEEYLKPGTGVWTIDSLQAPTLDELKGAEIKTTLASDDLNYLHVKDPFLYSSDSGELRLLYCTHPFGWTSSNTAFVQRTSNEDRWTQPNVDWFPRGTTWDVAMSRGTGIVDVPAKGEFANRHVSLMFYDGGESVRELPQHPSAVSRPRGHSCEELGGVAFFVDGDFSTIERLTLYEPLLVSPHGTGCSRYVDVLNTPSGMHVSWQQSQTDHSQPLVHHFVETQTIEDILSS